MSKTARTTIFLVIILLLVGAGVYLYVQNRTPKVASFEECAKHYATMETYPATCKDKDGATYTQDIGNELSKVTLITIDAPRPNAVVSMPMDIRGRARGTWFFEASFPVELRAADGTVLGQTHAEAQGEWMTENFVDYKATLTFPPQPKGTKGTLYLKKDNPSGDPSRDDALVIPVVF